MQLTVKPATWILLFLTALSYLSLPGASPMPTTDRRTFLASTLAAGLAVESARGFAGQRDAQRRLHRHRRPLPRT